jgi:hypothetical protein
MLPSNCQHNFAMYLSSLVTLVYKGLTFRRDLSEARRTIPKPPFSHVPHGFHPYPTGNVLYGYYIRVRFGDMANAIFCHYFCQGWWTTTLLLQIASLDFFACKACLIVWRFNMQGLLLW